MSNKVTWTGEIKKFCDYDRPILIGFGHRKQVGKDTIAAKLLDKLSPLAMRFAFADSLYWCCEKLGAPYNFQSKSYYDRNPQSKETLLHINKTPREILLAMGKSIREIFPEDIFIDVLDRDILEVSRIVNLHVAIISDIRYPNEFQYVKNYGYVFRIDRGSNDVSADCDDLLTNREDWDGCIDNNGSKETISNIVDELYAILSKVSDHPYHHCFMPT